MLRGNTDSQVNAKKQSWQKKTCCKLDTTDSTFANNTTCHGIRNIVQARTWLVTFIWTSCFLFAFGCLLYTMIMLVQGYLSYSAVTEVTVQHRPQMDFPAVTVCNFNRFKKDAVKKTSAKYGIQPNDWVSYLTAGFANMRWFLNVNSTKKLNKYSTLFKDIDQKIIDYHGKGIDFSEVFDQVGYDEGDLLVMQDCTFANERCGNSRQGPVQPDKVVTQYGNCFSFNYQNGVKERSVLQQLSSGSGNGLSLLLNVSEDTYAENLDMGYPQQGIKFLVHSPHVHPMIDTEGFAVQPGVHAFGGIRKTKHINVPPKWGECVNKTLKFFRTYSREACLQDCFMRKLETECNCIPILYKHNVSHISTCGPTDMLHCASHLYDKYSVVTAKCANNCGPACQEQEHIVSLSVAALPNKGVAKEFALNYNQTVEYVRHNFLYLEVYYQRMMYVQILQQASMTLPQLLANMGGQLGLFIGGSILTIVEFLEYLLMKIYFFGTDKCKKKKPHLQSDNDSNLSSNSELQAERSF